MVIGIPQFAEIALAKMWFGSFADACPKVMHELAEENSFALFPQTVYSDAHDNHVDSR